MKLDLLTSLYVFMLAAFIGFEVIRRVSPLLHTPLMSLTNALDAIAVVGAILLAGEYHAHGATLADGLIAHELTQHILVLFGTAVLRYRQGVPERCEACGSYQFELWADEPSVPMKPRCRSCGWTKDDALPADAGGKGRAEDNIRREKRR